MVVVVGLACQLAFYFVFRFVSSSGQPVYLCLCVWGANFVFSTRAMTFELDVHTETHTGQSSIGTRARARTHFCLTHRFHHHHHHHRAQSFPCASTRWEEGKWCSGGRKREKVDHSSMSSHVTLVISPAVCWHTGKN